MQTEGPGRAGPVATAPVPSGAGCEAAWPVHLLSFAFLAPEGLGSSRILFVHR